MINFKARQELLALVQRQDYSEAARVYLKAHGRYINPRYFEKFLKGQRMVSGQKPGSHQPLDMYAAVVEAIKQREAESAAMTETALSLKRELEASC